MESYCDSWNSFSNSKIGLASSLLKGKILEQEKYSCNNQFIVLCIEAMQQIAATTTTTITRRKRNDAGTSNTTLLNKRVQIHEMDYDQHMKNIYHYH